MSDDLISRRALYDKAATLEAQALDYVGKLIERDGEETSVEWRIWSAILTERTAFKHDVFDAPSAQPNTPTDAPTDTPTDTTTAQRTGRWIDGKVKHIKNGELRNVRECSECGSSYFVYDNYNSVDEIPKFCPNCGCAMKGEEE